jgi:hypothetical protein
VPSANYSAERSSLVWQPDADSNVCFAHFFTHLKRANSHYSLQLAPLPDAASSNSKKVRKITILICSGLLYPTGWAAQPSKTYYGGFFFKDRETLRGYKTAFIFDEN